MTQFVSKNTVQGGAPTATRGMLRGGALVAGVEVSVLVSESHTLSANTTKLALESGAKVTDHVILDPADVSIVFAMTNTGGGADAARDAFEVFQKLMQDRTLLDLTTEHHVYDNMVVVSLAPLHQAPYKGALTVTVRLQQVSFVQLERAGRVSGKGRAAKTAAPPVNAGQQDVKPVKKSLLARAADNATTGGK